MSIPPGKDRWRNVTPISIGLSWPRKLFATELGSGDRHRSFHSVIKQEERMNSDMKTYRCEMMIGSPSIRMRKQQRWKPRQRRLRLSNEQILHIEPERSGSLEIEAKETWWCDNKWIIWCDETDAVLYVFHIFRCMDMYWYVFMYIYTERALQAELHCEKSSAFMFSSAKDHLGLWLPHWNKNDECLHQHAATNTQQDFQTTYTMYTSYFWLKTLQSQPSLYTPKVFFG